MLRRGVYRAFTAAHNDKFGDIYEYIGLSARGMRCMPLTKSLADLSGGAKLKIEKNWGKSQSYRPVQAGQYDCESLSRLQPQSH